MRNILKLFADTAQRDHWITEQGQRPGVTIRHAAYTVLNGDSVIYCRIIRTERDADMLQGMEYHEYDASARGCLLNCSDRAYDIVRARVRLK